MAEEVEIIGVDGGPASEATLRRVLDELKRKNTSKNAQQRFQDLYNQALRDGTRVVSDFDDQVEDTTKTVKTFGDRISSVLNIFRTIIGRGYGFLTGTLNNLIEAFADGQGRITDFAAMFPLFGDQLSRLIGIFENVVPQFQDLAKVGAGFQGSLGELRVEAARARVSLENYTALVVNNSEKLAAFGGTVLSGAKRFTQLNQMLGDQRVGLMNLGLSFEDINEALIDYQYLNRMGSRLEKKSTEEVAAAAADYTKDLLMLSKLTGEDIKVAREKLIQSQMDIAFQKKLSQLDGDQQKILQKQIAEATLMGPEAVNTVKRQFLGFPPITEEARAFVTTFPEITANFQDMVNKIKSGDITLEEFNKTRTERLGTMIDNARNSADRFNNILGAASFGLGGFAQTILSVASDATILTTKFLTATAEEQEAILKRAEEEGKGTSPLLNAFNTFRDMMTTFKIFLEEKIIAPLEAPIGTAIKSFGDILKGIIEDEDVKKWSQYFVAAFNEQVENFKQDLKTKGFVTALEELFFGGFGNEVDERGMEIRQRGLFERMDDFFRDFWNNETVQGYVDTFLDNIATGFTTVLEKVWNNIWGRTPKSPAEIEAEKKLASEVDKLVADKALLEKLKEVKTAFENATYHVDKIKSLDIINKNLPEGQKYTVKQIEDIFKTLKEHGVEGFNKGTKGFENFGKGTLAMLHGREAVIPLNSKLGKSLSDLMEAGQSKRVEIPTKLTENANILSMPPITTEQMRAIATGTQQDNVTRNLEQLNNTMMQVVSLLQQNSRQNQEIQSSLKKMRGIVY